MFFAQKASSVLRYAAAWMTENLLVQRLCISEAREMFNKVKFISIASIHSEASLLPDHQPLNDKDGPRAQRVIELCG